MTRENHETKAFARRLCDLMRARGHVSPGSNSGVDVSAMANALGISYEMARRYAEGLAMPRPGKLAALARWLGVTPAALAFGAQATNKIDERVLGECLRAIREAQERTGVSLSTERAAHLVAVLYGEAQSGEIPTAKTVELMIRAST